MSICENEELKKNLDRLAVSLYEKQLKYIDFLNNLKEKENNAENGIKIILKIEEEVPKFKEEIPKFDLEDFQKEIDKICKITIDEYIKKHGEEFQKNYELEKELEELKRGK